MTGGLIYKYKIQGLHWQDGACFVVTVILGVFVAILTQNAKGTKEKIVKACTPKLGS